MVKPTRDIPKEPEQEPWGACVSGRVFVGALPEHVRKLAEDNGLTIQWLYTTPPQRKPLTNAELFKEWEENTSCDMPDTFEQFKHTARSIEAAHGIKE